MDNVERQQGKIVQVTVSGGVVQHVEVPEGVTVIVRDYEVDGVESDLIHHDENNDKYIKSIWNRERTTNANV